MKPKEDEKRFWREKIARAGTRLSATLFALLVCAGCVGAKASGETVEENSMNKQVGNRYAPETLRVNTRRDFPVSAEKVWKIIAGFNSLPDYHASIVHSELKQGGVVRHITMSDDAGGGVVVERLVFYDDVDMIFSYRIIDLIDCEMAFRDYQAWVRLEPLGAASCRLHWGSDFNVEGATGEETDELAREIYKGCFDGIQNVLEAQR